LLQRVSLSAVRWNSEVLAHIVVVKKRKHLNRMCMRACGDVKISRLTVSKHETHTSSTTTTSNNTSISSRENNKIMIKHSTQ
jgi:hypothetical protein